MKPKNYVISGIVIVLFLFVSYAALSFFTSPLTKQVFTGEISTPRTSFTTTTTGSTEEGDVAIAVTPQSITDDSIIVLVEMNTHFVDLGQFDLAKIVVLTYDFSETKTIKPSSTFQPSGHHASGEIIFFINEKPDSFIITISDIPKIQTRTYRWEVEL